LLSAQVAKRLQIETEAAQAALLIRFVGSSRTVVTQTAQALKVLRESGQMKCTAHDNDAAFWSELIGLPLQAGDDLGWRAVMRPSDLYLFLNEITRLDHDGASHPELKWHAGLGDGRVRVMARAPVYHREAVRALEQLRRKAETLGGS